MTTLLETTALSSSASGATPRRPRFCHAYALSRPQSVGWRCWCCLLRPSTPRILTGVSRVPVPVPFLPFRAKTFEKKWMCSRRSEELILRSSLAASAELQHSSIQNPGRPPARDDDPPSCASPSPWWRSAQRCSRAASVRFGRLLRPCRCIATCPDRKWPHARCPQVMGSPRASTL